MLRGQHFGLSVALVTPFAEDRSIDLPRLAAHARQSLADGCNSVTLFGTTGEGASIVGIAATSVEDAIAQGRAGLRVGCPSFLLAPPFYFKGVREEGVFDWLPAVLTGLGPQADNIVLYHIPQVTAVGLSAATIDRLCRTFPSQIKGVKDSSGDWKNARALLERHGDLHVLIGDERLLSAAMREGASGAISGLANIAPDLMRPLLEGIDEPRIDAMAKQVLPYGIAAIKALVGLRRNDAVAWSRMRAPLASLGKLEVRELGVAIDLIRAQAAA